MQEFNYFIIGHFEISELNMKLADVHFKISATGSNLDAGREVGAGEWWMSLSSGLSYRHLPSQMFHCASLTTPPEGWAVNSGIPPSCRLSIWKDLMMNNKATGLYIHHFLHQLSPLQPRIQFWWVLKRTTAGSGRELGSDPCHAFRPPGLEGVLSEQTDRLSLSDPSGVRQGGRCCAAILGSGFQHERSKWRWRRKECVRWQPK